MNKEKKENYGKSQSRRVKIPYKLLISNTEDIKRSCRKIGEYKEKYSDMGGKRKIKTVILRERFSFLEITVLF